MRSHIARRIVVAFIVFAASMSGSAAESVVAGGKRRAVRPSGPLLRLGPSARTLGPNREQMDTPYFSVGPFGWFGLSIDEQHPAFYYPTPADYSPPGYFMLDAQNSARADFDGDGDEDLVVTWYTSPHTVERLSRLTFTMFLNEGGGRFRYAPEIFEGGQPPLRFFAYRTATADFNGDRRPDLIASSMGMIKRNPDGPATTAFEPIPLALSTPAGTLRDASANIEGQENGGLPEGFTFGHDLSVGDVNADGSVDFYTGKCLFLNDGHGKFSNATAQLPLELRPNDIYIMTSLIGDLNGDGVGDIVAAYADGDLRGRSGAVLLSRAGTPALSGRDVVPLPPGRYGAGLTKFNHGAIYDVDRDGRADIVFSVTRAQPYYRGRQLQVLMNKGDGVFVDETTSRVVAPADLDAAQGEGTLHVVDANRDGVLDLVHCSGGGIDLTDPPSVTIYLNVNGQLRAVDRSVYAWVQPWQIAGFGESFRPFQSRPMSSALPIDIDGKAGVDFVAVVQVPLRSWPQAEPSEYVLYSILSVAPLP
jgi:hypothetical protein